MPTLVSRCAIAAAALFFSAAGALAQDLVITNARILDGTGQVIERGSVVVRGGKIESVSAGTPAASGARTIDAGGKTVMPGLIDAHRHLVHGDGAQWLTSRRTAAAAGIPRRGLHHRAVRDRSAAAARSAQANATKANCAGPRLFAGAFLPLAGATGGGGADRAEIPRAPIPHAARCRSSRRPPFRATRRSRRSRPRHRPATTT